MLRKDIGVVVALDGKEDGAVGDIGLVGGVAIGLIIGIHIILHFIHTIIGNKLIR
jgi:hypothetical protein